MPSNSFLTNLRQDRVSAGAAYGQFLGTYKYSGSTLHAFFEGPEDEAVYMNHLDKRVPDGFSFFPYRCKNKDDVYSSYLRIDFNRHQKNRVLFFVDKDLSDFLNEQWPTDSNIFVTHCYSVENYLVNPEMVGRVLRQILHNYNAETFKAVSYKFEEQYRSFVREMTIVMAWILLARQQRLPANLSDIKLEKLFGMQDDLKFIRRPGITIPEIVKQLELDTKCKLPAKTAKKRSQLTQQLSSQDPKTFIRGKYDLWFLILFLNKLREALQKIAGKGSNPGNIPGVKEAVSVLGPRISSIPELELFLDLNWKGL